MIKIMGEIEVRKDGKVYCVYVDETMLPDMDTMRSIKAAGYKFYKDGKIYRPEKKATQN